MKNCFTTAVLLAVFLWNIGFCQNHDKPFISSLGFAYENHFRPKNDLFACSNITASDNMFFTKYDTLSKCRIIPEKRPFDEMTTNLIEASLITGLFMVTDEASWKFTRDGYQDSRILKTGFDYAVDLGDGKYSIGLAGVMALDGFLTKNYKQKKISLQIIESMVVSGVLVQSLKRIFGRESPASCSRATGKWRPFPNLMEYQKQQPKYYAFPSGHMTTLVSTLTILSNNYPDCTWLKPVSYGLVGILGASLVAKNMHWYSDLPMGVLIGYTVGNFISGSGPKESTSGNEQKKEYFRFSPYAGCHHSGVRLSYHF